MLLAGKVLGFTENAYLRKVNSSWLKYRPIASTRVDTPDNTLGQHLLDLIAVVAARVTFQALQGASRISAGVTPPADTVGMVEILLGSDNVEVVFTDGCDYVELTAPELKRSRSVTSNGRGPHTSLDASTLAGTSALP
jgi:hypothetical protein